MQVSEYNFPIGERFTITRHNGRRFNYVTLARITEPTTSGSCIVDVKRYRADGEVSIVGHGYRYFHSTWALETKPQTNGSN